jgi:hypothetical protein
MTFNQMIVRLLILTLLCCATGCGHKPRRRPQTEDRIPLPLIHVYQESHSDGNVLIPELPPPENPQCEIHGADLVLELVPIHYGPVSFPYGYATAVRTQFPHPPEAFGGSVISSFQSNGFIRKSADRVRLWVCPDCVAAYRVYWGLPQAPH